MKRICCLSFLIVVSLPIFGEDGLEYRGDIDGDGKPDLIQSGPKALFGTGGGPFTMTLSRFNRQYALGGRGDWSIERSEKFIRFWSYWHLSSNSGWLGYVEIDLATGKMKDVPGENQIEISIGAGGTAMGNRISEAVFNSGSEIISAHVVHDYTPPATNVDGSEWGK